MEISFIIPLFNRLDLTRACIESLQATLPDGLAHEIILVDDGSTDGTREWAASLPPPTFVALFNERRGGYAYGNNRAARIARGRLLALVNNDLEFEPGWLPPMLHPFDRGRQVGIVGNIQLRMDSGALDHAGVAVGLAGKPEHINGTHGPVRLWRPYSKRQAVTGACCLVERTRFLETGGFDEDFTNGGEDIDFCFRLRDHGAKVLVANRSVVRHHVSASPGRNTFHERNSRRLFSKWRDRLILDGASAWPRAYLAEHWHEPRDFEHRLLRQALPRFLKIISKPAPHALQLLDENIKIEEARWDSMLGPREDVP